MSAFLARHAGPPEPADSPRTGGIRPTLKVQAPAETARETGLADPAEMRILLVEDSLADARLVEVLLSEVGTPSFEVVHVRRSAEAVHCLAKAHFDAILLDLGLPDARDLEALARLAAAAPDLPIVVLTGRENETLAVQAMRHGAQDYLVKGWSSGRVLTRSIRHAIERKRGEQHISHLAYYDALTDLPNRSLLHDRLIQALAQAVRQQELLAVVFIDLDLFKTVNDTLGHAAGDELLVQVADRLRSAIRHGDTAARIGGDEFALLLADMPSIDDVRLAIERVAAAFGRPFPVKGQELYVSASIGASLYPTDGHDVDSLLRNADTAMYEVKQRGRNHFHFYAPMMSGSPDRLALGTGLRRALAQGELCLHYQPEVRVEDGAVVAVEALVRWPHPARGLLSAEEFMPLAEESGLIGAIDEWVLGEACGQIARWQAEGRRCRVAVNLSRRQLHRAGLAATVRRALDAHGIDGALLELELTETSVMRLEAQAAQGLAALKSVGVSVALDDFGTGYSTLSLLGRLPIDRLKIDRSFLRDCPTSTTDASIVRAIVTMAHALGIEVLAEGVETQAQLHFVRESGCNLAQGFYLCRPLPPSEVTRFAAGRTTG